MSTTCHHIADAFPFDKREKVLSKVTRWWKYVDAVDLTTLDFATCESFHSLVQSSLKKHLLFKMTNDHGRIVKVKWKNQVFPLVLKQGVDEEDDDEDQTKDFLTIILVGNKGTTLLKQHFYFKRQHWAIAERFSSIETVNGSAIFSGTFIVSLAQQLDHIFAIQVSYLTDKSTFDNVSSRFIQTVLGKISFLYILFFMFKSFFFIHSDKEWFYTSKGGYLPIYKEKEKTKINSLKELKQNQQQTRQELVKLYQHPLLWKIRLDHQNQKQTRRHWARLYHKYSFVWRKICMCNFDTSMYRVYL
jgi:hypothetical protein